MKWFNLKQNKCPKCGKELRWDSKGFFCNSAYCDFRISAKRFKEIVDSQVKQDLEKDETEEL